MEFNAMMLCLKQKYLYIFSYICLEESKKRHIDKCQGALKAEFSVPSLMESSPFWVPPCPSL